MVLIKIDKEFNNEIKYSKSKITLYINPSYSKERHSTVTGTVVILPLKLIYNVHNNRNSMDWKCDMELEIGDKVWCNWTAFRKAFSSKTNLVFSYKDELHILVNYKNIIVSKRNSEIICLNGYCLIEPTKEVDLPESIRPVWINKLIKSKLEIPKTTIIISKLYGRVYKVGKPNSEYSNEVYSDGRGENISVGDIILFAKAADSLLEYDLHKSLVGDKSFYKIQRRLMNIVIKNE